MAPKKRPRRVTAAARMRAEIIRHHDEEIEALGRRALALERHVDSIAAAVSSLAGHDVQLANLIQSVRDAREQEIPGLMTRLDWLEARTPRDLTDRLDLLEQEDGDRCPSCDSLHERVKRLEAITGPNPIGNFLRLDELDVRLKTLEASTLAEQIAAPAVRSYDWLQQRVKALEVSAELVAAQRSAQRESGLRRTAGLDARIQRLEAGMTEVARDVASVSEAGAARPVKLRPPPDAGVINVLARNDLELRDQCRRLELRVLTLEEAQRASIAERFGTADLEGGG